MEHEDEIPAPYERDAELEAEIDKIIDVGPNESQADADGVKVKIRIGVAINGYKRGDELTVDRNHPLFGGLIDQNLAEVIG